MVLDVRLTVHRDDSASIDYMKVMEGYPTKYFVEGDYSLQVADSVGNVVLEKSFVVDFFVDADPPVELDKSLVSFRLPYSSDMKSISIYHGSSLIHSSDIAVCVIDGVCGVSETYLSCPTDCRLGKEDGICQKTADGFCDPDCLPGVDSDCSETPEEAVEIVSGNEPVPVTASPEVPAVSQDSVNLLFYVLGFVVILVLLFFLLLRWSQQS